MKIALASDHAAWKIKELIKPYLTELGHTYEDFGTSSEDSVDYPDFAAAATQAIVDKKCELGILLCGSGLGMSMVANKFKGIRAAVCHNEFTAEMSRRHNDANVLCMGVRIMEFPQIKELIKIWLETPFEAGRHAKRVNKIKEIEDRSL